MYNEQQRYDRDTYINVYTNNIQPANRFHFDKIT
ncbi:M12 family metallopeptidase [Bacteroides caecimuris]